MCKWVSGYTHANEQTNDSPRTKEQEQRHTLPNMGWVSIPYLRNASFESRKVKVHLHYLQQSIYDYKKKKSGRGSIVSPFETNAREKEGKRGEARNIGEREKGRAGYHRKNNQEV